MENKIQNALEIAFEYGQIDGEHHKTWAIDQMVRALTGCPIVNGIVKDSFGNECAFEYRGESEEYRKFIAKFEEGDDGANTYEWDAGINP